MRPFEPSSANISTNYHFAEVKRRRITFSSVPFVPFVPFVLSSSNKNQPSKRPSNLKASQRPRLGNHWAKLTFQSVPLRSPGTLRNCKKARKHWLGTLGTLQTGSPGRRSPPSDLRPLASSPESLREPKRGSV